ncbi:hybrid sensor histidine kinase/response regulator [Bartonella choladocola]|uniref:histidine kinase n=1 Tax=Bartonella choladocola TaxID=2750995 RepID=A0A1U9MHZ0_9HYPH|nr:PAS domain-containing sensor histidine kinase [Bartonella choladocola]AQT47358.1 cell cycle control histidine kinase CckA [Bartonella choladocola]
MKKPEEMDNKLVFSEKYKRFVKLIAGAIVLVSIAMAFAGVFVRNRQFDFAAKIMFLFLALIGFSVLIVFLSGTFERFYRKDRGGDGLSGDMVEDALLLTDASGHIINANVACRNLTEFDKSKTVFSLFSSLQNAEQIIYRLTAKALSGEVVREQAQGTRPLWSETNGETQSWYNLTVRPIKREGVLCLLWRLQDIGFARDMYAPLFRNLQEAINYLDQSPAGFLSVDQNGSVLYINATLANALNIDLSKFKRGELTFDSLFKSGEYGETWSQLKQHMKEGGNNHRFRIEWRNREDRHKIFLALAASQTSEGEDETFCRLVFIPAEGQADSINVLPATSDIFRYYFNYSPLALATIGRDGTLFAINKPFHELFDIKNDDSGKKSLIGFFSESGKRDIGEIIRKISQDGHGSLTTEVSLATNENRHFRLYFLGLSKELNQSDDEVAILSVIETTAQKTLEDKMAQGQKLQAVGQLAGGIAHDFNNVLTAIIMSCDLLLASHRSSDPAHADLINIKNNANRAASLVQQLLAFSRRQTLRPEVVDFTELLSDVRNLLMPLLGSNIHLKFNHGRDLWNVKVDQASFQRVLMNLVINARDAMPKGGTITITTTNMPRQKIANLAFNGLNAGDYVELDVEDTGTGIPKAVQDKMFEPFFTTKEVGKGTGLGLSMVYGIVKQTGGYIYCESEEGKGTRFRIFLPRFVAENTQNTQKPTEPAKSPIEKNADLSGTATVLLVEDEAAVRMGGVRALQSRGYTVLEAENGLEALDIIAEHNGAVDLVVSDVVMPEMDGPTLLGEMRKRYPEIKFVFVSGYAKDAFAKNLPSDAVFGFLSKPFTLKQLAMKVKEMLSDNSNNSASN